MSEWQDNTGMMPVSEGTLVDVIFRDGEELLGVPAGVDTGSRRYAEDWSLGGREWSGDIMKWRLSVRKIHVCTTCGSPRVFADAYASLNTDEVRTFDYIHCDDCDGECKTQEVTVSADFDLTTDFYAAEGGEE